MRFALLGSGSRGNATLVEAGDSRVLVDCGFSVAETERRLGRLGLVAADIDALLVTHEHGDHIRGVAPFARRHGTPVWMTAGTALAARDTDLPVVEWHSGHEPFVIGGLEITPFPVPHDAREPCQFTFSDGARRLGVLTDLGSPTPCVVAALDGCDALVLECNHDPGLLARGPYPPALKARVAGALGHLSNGQAADLLGRLDCSRLQHLVAAHLSEKNNLPALATAALAGVLGCGADWIAVADQDLGLDWRAIA